MKNVYYITILVLFALYSCKKQNEFEMLPLDKLYILECNYVLPEEYEEPRFEFYVAGFCELNKDFNIKYARQLFYNSYDYYNSEDIVPDSLRNKISNTLLKYQTDTTFLYQGEPGGRIYDGNAYRFIMQKHNQKDIIIKFEPRFLPEDLKFVYSFLYEDREKTEDKSKYHELFEMFENQVKNDTTNAPLPPPMLKSTVKFKPPVIKNKK
jgi:hypothetical protein